MTAVAQPGLLILGLAFLGSGAGVARAGVRRLGAAVALTGALLVAAAVVGDAAWGERLGVAALLVVLPVALLLHPDGAPPPGLGWVGPAVPAAAGVLAAVDPDRYLATGAVPLATPVLVIAALWWRHERAGERERLALLWLFLGTGTAVLLGLHVDFLLTGPARAVGLGVAALPLPAALLVGAVAPQRGDVRGLTARAVVLAVTALAFVAAFAGVVAAARLATGRQPSVAVLAVVGALCAAGFAPLATLLRGAVGRMLFGDRDAPAAAASRVGARLADDPVPALRALREALALPYAALERDGAPVAASGVAPPVVRRVPLRVGDAAVAELAVGLRPGTTRLDGTDEAALRAVAPALAQTVLAADRAVQLRASRAALITAVEDERRRLRRDLHDGLGPTLTGVAFTADAAGNRLAADPAGAAELLRGLRRDVGDAITDVRRLVEGLRPPAVDELGLVGALTQQAARMRAADGRPLVVRLDVPRPLPALPAAVEVAAYRIVVEALTNVARHAAGAEAAVTLCPDGARLRIAVRDGGAAGAWVPGVGLTSMRERAEQLGGTFRAGGGEVEVALPL